MRIAVIPDTQAKPDVDFSYLEAVGKYIVRMKPDVIVHLGDHWDMPSLSSYDKKGGRRMEGRRYHEDIKAGNTAMDILMKPIEEERQRQRDQKKKIWTPRKVFLLGNHEHRIERAVDDDPKVETLLTYDHFNLQRHGWEVVPFLEPIVIEGVAFCHYFTSGVMGRPVASARAMLTKKFMSCIMGHVQDRDIAYARRADGSSMTGLFAGICYEHDEDYLTPQTNGSWSGVWILNDVRDGSFDELPVSLKYIKEKYSGLRNPLTVAA